MKDRLNWAIAILLAIGMLAAIVLCSAGRL